jgi:hypothetical protein
MEHKSQQREKRNKMRKVYHENKVYTNQEVIMSDPLQARVASLAGIDKLIILLRYI